MDDSEILKQKYTQIDKAMGVLEDLSLEVYQTDHEDEVMKYVEKVIRILTYEEDI